MTLAILAVIGFALVNVVAGCMDTGCQDWRADGIGEDRDGRRQWSLDDTAG